MIKKTPTRFKKIELEVLLIAALQCNGDGLLGDCPEHLKDRTEEEIYELWESAIAKLQAMTENAK